MNINRVKIIIKFETIKSLHKKSFIIMTFFFPILLTFIIYANTFKDYKPFSLAVVNNISKSFSLDSCAYFTPHTINNIKKSEITFNNKYDGILFLRQTANNKLKAELYFNKVLSKDVQIAIYNQIQNKYANYLSNDSLNSIKNRIKGYILFSTYNKEGGYKYINIVIMSIFIITFIIFQFSNSIMKSIMIERQNKIAEILLTSVKSSEIISGKIISGFIVTIIQIVLWGIILIAILSLFNFNSPNIGQFGLFYQIIPTLSLKQILCFTSVATFCLIGAYLIYSILFAFLGVISDIGSDTQQYSLLVTLPLIISMLYIIQNLGKMTSLITFLSYFPLTSPLALLARFTTKVTFTEIVISLSILYATIIICLHFSASLYKKGVISYRTKNVFKQKKH